MQQVFTIIPIFTSDKYPKEKKLKHYSKFPLLNWKQPFA